MILNIISWVRAYEVAAPLAKARLTLVRSAFNSDKKKWNKWEGYSSFQIYEIVVTPTTEKNPTQNRIKTNLNDFKNSNVWSLQRWYNRNYNITCYKKIPILKMCIKRHQRPLYGVLVGRSWWLPLNFPRFKLDLRVCSWFGAVRRKTYGDKQFATFAGLWPLPSP